MARSALQGVARQIFDMFGSTSVPFPKDFPGFSGCKTFLYTRDGIGILGWRESEQSTHLYLWPRNAIKTDIVDASLSVRIGPRFSQSAPVRDESERVWIEMKRHTADDPVATLIHLIHGTLLHMQHSHTSLSERISASTFGG